MLDGSQQDVAVTWDVTDADYEAMRTGGVAEYTYTGTADGMEATITVQMIEFNFLDDYSFEDSENKEQSAAWTVINYGAEDTEIYVEAKASDSKTGTNHYHFWNESADAINFDLQQEVTLEAGSYKFSICTMGGDCGESYTAYIYVIINGETVCTEECLFTAYDEWHTAEIPSFTVADGDSVTVGIHVEIPAAGAWGKIDDALLNSLS
ncbi:MAG: Ig-like domain-containing protein [Firmicutes bacterium]|nr:Ig-like domain-containing protein [Bacillota bacterium]